MQRVRFRVANYTGHLPGDAFVARVCSLLMRAENRRIDSFFGRSRVQPLDPEWQDTPHVTKITTLGTTAAFRPSRADVQTWAPPSTRILIIRVRFMARAIESGVSPVSFHM